MVHAPARAAGCALDLAMVDVTAVLFNQEWEVLGYVTLLDNDSQDSEAEANRALVRPRACAMGGTTIALAANSINTTQFGQGSALVYMVMRSKPTTLPPVQKF